MKEPREHQLRGHDLLRDGFRSGKRRGILCMPCAAGKTVTTLEMFRLAALQGRRCLFLCDRRTLVAQAAREGKEYGLHCGVLMADDFTGMWDSSAPVQFASKDSLLSWHGRQDYQLPPADLVAVDECHRSAGETYRALLAAYPGAWEVGLTATPIGGAGNRGLGEDRYEFIVQPIHYSELIALGYLCPARCFAPGARVEKGKAKRPRRADMIGDVVGWWKRLAPGRRTFVFASGVKHSMALRDEFRAKGIPAEHLDGTTPDEERDAVLGRNGTLARGEVLVVCSCSVLKYGVDVPSVEAVVLADGFASLVDYLQACGRGLRSAPGKSDCVVIDHAGSVLYHGFPDADREWELSGDRDHAADYRERMKKGEAPKPITCPECFCLFSGRPDCPSCGWKPKGKTAQKLGNRNGVLVEVGRDRAYVPDQQDLNRGWLRCVFTASNSGRPLGAAVAMFRQRFSLTPWDARVHPLPGNPGAYKRPASEFVAEVYPNRRGFDDG